MRTTPGRVADRIERYRVKKEWNYRELAKALGVSVSQAHGWATGAHSPNLASLRKIAKRLGVAVAELLS